MTGTEWPVIRQRETRLEKKNLATLILLVAGLSAILLLVMGGKMSAANARIIAIVFSCILLWATAVIPGLLVSLLFFFFCRRFLRPYRLRKYAPSSHRVHSGLYLAVPLLASRSRKAV